MSDDKDEIIISNTCLRCGCKSETYKRTGVTGLQPVSEFRHIVTECRKHCRCEHSDVSRLVSKEIHDLLQPVVYHEKNANLPDEFIKPEIVSGKVQEGIEFTKEGEIKVTVHPIEIDPIEELPPDTGPFKVFRKLC